MWLFQHVSGRNRSIKCTDLVLSDKNANIQAAFSGLPITFWSRAFSDMKRFFIRLEGQNMIKHVRISEMVYFQCFLALRLRGYMSCHGRQCSICRVLAERLRCALNGSPTLMPRVCDWQSVLLTKAANEARPRRL